MKQHDPPLSTTMSMQFNVGSKNKKLHDQLVVHTTHAALGHQRKPKLISFYIR